VPVAATLLYADARWAGFSFLAPAVTSGVATLLVKHVNYTSLHIRGTSAVLRLQGFASASAPAHLTLDVDGVVALVGGVTPVAGSPGGVDVSFTLPAASLDAIQVVARTKTTLVSDATVFAFSDVTYHRAPRLAAARFNAIGSQILLTFDQNTDGANTLACEAALDTARLGAKPACTWVAPGPSSATLERSVRSEAPKLLLSGPSEIGSCDTATLRVSAASPRPLTFRWGSSSDAMLDGNLTTEVQGITFLGTASDVAEHTLTVLDGVPPPLLIIAMPSTPPLRTKTLWVSAIAKYSACAEDTTASLAYSWAVSRGGEYAEDRVLLTATGAEMQVPEDTFSPGETYHVRLLGVLTSGTSASASQIFTVGRSPLLARIAGGAARTVSRTATLTLDASNSADPDICPPPAESAGGFSGAVHP
ncbi:hypothetical protein T484DRAFT_1817085, partial [Baffinella frigidus]